MSNPGYHAWLLLLRSRALAVAGCTLNPVRKMPTNAQLSAYRNTCVIVHIHIYILYIHDVCLVVTLTYCRWSVFHFLSRISPLHCISSCKLPVYFDSFVIWSPRRLYLGTRGFQESKLELCTSKLVFARMCGAWDRPVAPHPDSASSHPPHQQDPVPYSLQTVLNPSIHCNTLNSEEDPHRVRAYKGLEIFVLPPIPCVYPIREQLVGPCRRRAPHQAYFDSSRWVVKEPYLVLFSPSLISYQVSPRGLSYVNLKDSIIGAGSARYSQAPQLDWPVIPAAASCGSLPRPVLPIRPARFALALN